MAAGEENAPEEHADWFGQPAQAEDLPASCEVGPTHPALASDGASTPSDEFMMSGLDLKMMSRDRIENEVPA